MALDAALLAEVEKAVDPRTIVRFYSWSCPALSLGRNQKIERAADLEYCRAQGITVVHRPTGGRAVLHGVDELTYAVVSNDPAAFDGGAVYATYRRISEALVDGYRMLGVDAVLAPDTTRHTRVDGHEDPCFVSPSRYELMVGGRKVVGSAQRRLRSSFLQHGSMPITCDRGRLAAATRMPDASILDREMAGLSECMPETPAIEALVEVFRRAFEQRFRIRFRNRSRRPQAREAGV
jgi:lipoate-protein ligase A